MSILMEDRPITPTFSHHARMRCAEMGISTKVAKRIVQNPSMTYSGNPPHITVYFSTEYPEYKVMVDPDWNVVTVVFACTQEYIRRGTTYEIVEPREGD